jgi:photosystem II stability/assembly factor-like uncharacterized protein
MLVVVLAAFAAACGGANDIAAPTEDPEEHDAGPVHVHGLGVDPADGALFVATHTGLFRVGAGETNAARVAGSAQDTMGFTVVGPNHFLGSGHPDPVEAVENDLPPHLGLIESTDAGRTWVTVSLAGEADFHVLRAHGDHVYGVDASTGRFLASTDGGRSWQERPLPGRIYDLVADPTTATRLVAATEQELAGSRDGGRSWRRVGPGVAALLAWPERDRLYAMLGDGSVRNSRDGGTTWRDVGSAGGEPAAFASGSDGDLYAALHDGTIKHSRDGGRTWRVRSRP